MPSDEHEQLPPTEMRGGTNPDAEEAWAKGEWAGDVADGMVPAALGGSDAPKEMLGDDSELGDAVLGQTAATDEPATDTGIDLDAGDNADATRDGGQNVPEDAEPDLRDAGAAILRAPESPS